MSGSLAIGKDGQPNAMTEASDLEHHAHAGQRAE
jgi:hypothetical protein